MGFTVLAVNFWDEPEDAVRAFAKDKGLNYPILLGGKSVGRKYGVRGIPANFYLDPQGRLVSSQEGLEDESAMEAAVKAILPRAPAAGR